MTIRFNGWRENGFLAFITSIFVATVMAGCASTSSQSVGGKGSSQVAGEQVLSPALETLVEQELASVLDSLAAGKRVSAGTRVVTVEGRYLAASGRICKKLVVGSTEGSGSKRSRLACKEGESWFYAKEVFADGIGQ